MLIGKVIQIVMYTSIGVYNMLIEKVIQIVMYTSIGGYNMLIGEGYIDCYVYIYWRV